MIHPVTPRNENPTNIPKVPPTLPTKDIVDITKYSLLTVLKLSSNRCSLRLMANSSDWRWGVKIVFEKEKLFVGPFERVLVEVASPLVLFEQDIPIDTNSLAMMLLIHS